MIRYPIRNIKGELDGSVIVMNGKLIPKVSPVDNKEQPQVGMLIVGPNLIPFRKGVVYHKEEFHRKMLDMKLNPKRLFSDDY